MIHPSADLASMGPFGVPDLVEGLRNVGVRDRDVLIVHVSLRSLGWVSGGGVALLEALRAVVGPAGTVIAPTFTTYLCDPMTWIARPVPPQWWDSIRDSLPGFDRRLHASQPGLGRFPEVLRSDVDAVRSNHPVYSLAAVGADAPGLLAQSPYDWALGSRGPLGRMVEAGVKILTIGIPWWSKCTLFHLAEHQTDYPGRLMYTVPMRIRTGQQSSWLPTRQLVFHDGDFAAMGSAGGAAVLGHDSIGAAAGTLVDGAQLVAVAGRWLLSNRDLTRMRLSPPFEAAVPAPAGVL